MRAVFEEAVKHSAPMTVVGRDLLYETAGLSMDGTMVVLRGATDYGPCRVNLLGAHQAVNAAVAVAASEVLAGLGYETGPDAVKRGLDTAIWPGRLEIISRKPLIVLDGAHNPDGMRALARAIREVFRRGKADFLLGILENRPVEEMAGLLVPLARRVVVTNVVGGTAPSAGVARLASVFAGTGAIIQAAPDPRDALRIALDGLPEDGLLCVCGSLYLVGMIRGMMVET
jgi:dihydrofolate synthase/folylpolyglutamate synthase